MRAWVFGLAAAATLGVASASAATVTKSYDFSASGFYSIYGGTPTTDPVTGSFTVTWDSSAPLTNVTTGVSGTLNIPYDAGLAFTYDTFFDGYLIIGGQMNGPSGMAYPSNDFWLSFFGPLTDTQRSASFGYTNNVGVFFANDVSVTVEAPSAVPEPASWALMIGGFFGLGHPLRRSRQSAARRPAA